MKKLLGLAILLAGVPVVRAADIEAGRQIATTVCAACHGANGVSVNDAIPNLAAQRSSYIEARLKAFKEGARPAPVVSPTAIMDAVATQLGADDIANVAAYFASQPGAPSGAKSALLANLVKTRMNFPDDYKATFTKYHTINFPATKQVRYYYANTTALAAARAGQPLPNGSVLIAEVYAAKLDADHKPISGADGLYVADKLLVYTAMASGADWGDDFPQMLRNGNWNYAVFTANKQQFPGLNQADCLACHKPLDSVSYTFTLKQLSEAK